MEIGTRAGLVGWLAGRMTLLLDFLFPELGRDHPAREPIAVNIIANMLGLGMAATPAGLKAMQEMAKDIRAAGDEARHLIHVHVSYFKYLVSAADSGDTDCLPERIWVKAAGGGAGTCAGGNGNFYAGGGGFLQGYGLEEQEGCSFMILWFSKMLLPLVISYVIAFGLISRRPIFDDFLDGAKNGMKTVADILPTLIGLITAVGVVRASGLLDAITDICAGAAGRGFCCICLGSTGRTVGSVWRLLS